MEIFNFDAESSDEATAPFRDFKDRAETVIEKDLDQAHAINKGLALWKGGIFGFLNSDVGLLPGSLQKIFEFRKRNLCPDLLYEIARYINSESEIEGDCRTHRWILKERALFVSQQHFGSAV